jgi:hypothetical protein
MVKQKEIEELWDKIFSDFSDVEDQDELAKILSDSDIPMNVREWIRVNGSKRSQRSI